MNPRNKEYIKDLFKIIEAVPFGDVEILVKRVDRKTAQLSTVSQETLRYVNNKEAIDDLFSMVTKLIEASFSGETHIKLEMKDGQIKIIGIFDKKDTKYS